MIPVLTPTDAAARLDELWSPRVLAAVDDTLVKVAKVHGSLTWHSHADEDELFLVVKGAFTMKLRERDVELYEGEMIIIPRGVEHKPVAENEVHVLLVEPKTTLNTGNVQNERSVADLDRI